MDIKDVKKTHKLTIPKGWTILAVKVITGIGTWSYSFSGAIKEGYLKPVNVSTGRYEVVYASSTADIRLVLAPC